MLDVRDVVQAVGVKPRAIPGALDSPGIMRFTGVSTDSRTLRPGELFVPLIGERFDGHDYLEEAFRKGAAGAVVSRAERLPAACSSGWIFPVADTLRALGCLGAGIALFFQQSLLAGWIGVGVAVVLIPTTLIITYRILPRTRFGRAVTYRALPP